MATPTASGYNPWGQQTWNSLGYTGPIYGPDTVTSMDNGNQVTPSNDFSPQLSQWLQSKGYTAQAPGYGGTASIMDAQGNALPGTSYTQGAKPKDNMWGDLATVGLIGAGMAFGLPTLGLGEGLGAAGSTAGMSALGDAAAFAPGIADAAATGATAFPVASSGYGATAFEGAPNAFSAGLGGGAAGAAPSYLAAPGAAGGLSGGILEGLTGAAGAAGAGAAGAAPGVAGAAAGAAGTGGFNWGSLLNPGLNLLGTLNSYNAAGKAGQAAGAAANAGADIQAKMRAPYVNAGTGALNNLTAGLAPGGEFNKPFTMADAQNSDAMKTALQYAQRGQDNSAAGKSGLLNSNAIQQSQQTSADIASQFQNQAFNQNLQQKQMALNGNRDLAGIGERATGTVADAQSNAAFVGGNAVGSTAVGQGNILGDAISKMGNSADTTKLLGQIFGLGSTGSSVVPDVAQVGLDAGTYGSNLGSLFGEHP